MFVISRLAPITPLRAGACSGPGLCVRHRYGGTFSGGASEGAGFTTDNPSTRRGEMLILDGTNMYQNSV